MSPYRTAAVLALTLITAAGCGRAGDVDPVAPTEPPPDQVEMIDRAEPPSGGEDRESAFDWQALAADDDYGVIVVTVLTSGDGAATNGAPPRVSVRVDEVLDGPFALGVHEMEWGVRHHGEDTAGAATERRVAAWAAQPVTPPPVGARFIVLAQRHGDHVSLRPKLRLPFDHATRDRVAGELRAAVDARAAQHAAEARRELARREAEEKHLGAPDIERMAREADLVAVARWSPRDQLGDQIPVVLEIRELLIDRRDQGASGPIVVHIGRTKPDRFELGVERLLFLRAGDGPGDPATLYDVVHGSLPPVPAYVIRARAALAPSATGAVGAEGRTCPRGQSLIEATYGTCWPWHCQVDADCATDPVGRAAEGHVCRAVAYCVEDVMVRGPREVYPDTRWHGPCDDAGACALGSCGPQRLCVREAPAAPPGPDE